MIRPLRALGLTLPLVLVAACGAASKQAASTAMPASATAGPVETRSTGAELVYAAYSVASQGLVERNVIAYDLASGRQLSSFEVGTEEDQALQVVLAGRRVVANLTHRIVSYALDGSDPRELRRAPDGGYFIGIGASLDGTKLALTEQEADLCATTPDPTTGVKMCRSYADFTSVAVIDPGDGHELMHVPQSDSRLSGYAGQLALISWRADGRGFAVSGYTYSEAPGGLATVMLDGSVRLDAEATYGRLAPNAHYLARGEFSYICGLGGAVEQHELSIRNLDGGRMLVSLQDAVLNFGPMEWSPDSAEYLYRTYRLNDDGKGCKVEDPSSIAWHTVRMDGSPPADEADPYSVRRRWYGDRVIEFRCEGQPALTYWCVSTSPSPPGGYVPSDVYVGGRLIGSAEQFELLGFLDR